ncbi:MAG: DUF1804 family protein [Desulfobacterales bacterium]|nr:DUF1804 family protein [Desulfobacterales bacterium]
MGAKGDRAAKEPLAMKLYADGASLTDISARLDISDTTLRRWKSESLIPGEDIDGWDKMRQQKRGNIQRLRDLFERELKFAEESEKGSISAPSMDALSKLGSLVRTWEAIEQAHLAQANERQNIDRPKLFLEHLEFMAEVLKETDPEGLKVLAKNFDFIVVKFKGKYAQAA